MDEDKFSENDLNEFNSTKEFSLLRVNSDQFQLNWNKHETTYVPHQLELFSIQGKFIKKWETNKINMAGLSKGIYLLDDKKS